MATCLIALALAGSGWAAADRLSPPPPPDPAPLRVDFRTVIVSVPDGRDCVEVMEFVGFHSLSKREFWLSFPAALPPSKADAWATTREDFDRQFTHAPRLEPAFYKAAQAQHRANLCLGGGIGLSGGLPAWALLAAFWPVRPPPFTAVVPADITASHSPAEVLASPLPTICEVRILSKNEAGGRNFPPIERQALAAVRRYPDGGLVAVSVQLAPSSPADLSRPARTGVAIRYELPLSGILLMLPLANDSRSTPPALTRIYLSLPPNRRGDGAGPVRGTNRAAQQVVADAFGAFGATEAFRLSWAKEHAGAAISSVAAADGSRVTRWVTAFRPVDGDLRVALQPAGLTPMAHARRSTGTMLIAILWPLMAAIYVSGILAAPRVYHWLTDLPLRTERWPVVLLAALGPILTPWFLLRYCARRDAPSPRTEDDSALGVLSMQSYECLARLVVWALLVCATWAILGLLATLGLWLRFGV